MSLDSTASCFFSYSVARVTPILIVVRVSAGCGVLRVLARGVGTWTAMALGETQRTIRQQFPYPLPGMDSGSR